MEKGKKTLVNIVFDGVPQLIRVTDEQLKLLKWLDNEYLFKNDVIINYRVNIVEDFDDFNE